MFLEIRVAARFLLFFPPLLGPEMVDFLHPKSYTVDCRVAVYGALGVVFSSSSFSQLMSESLLGNEPIVTPDIQSSNVINLQGTIDSRLSKIKMWISISFKRLVSNML